MPKKKSVKSKKRKNNLENGNSYLAPPRAGLSFVFCISKKPSPVGEGGPRQRWMRSYLKIENTSSVTLRVPPSPTGEGYSILPLILQSLSSVLFFN